MMDEDSPYSQEWRDVTNECLCHSDAPSAQVLLRELDAVLRPTNWVMIIIHLVAVSLFPDILVPHYIIMEIFDRFEGNTYCPQTSPIFP